jgi:hypothetical protein
VLSACPLLRTGRLADAFQIDSVLYNDFNYVWVRSFVLNGAPFSTHRRTQAAYSVSPGPLFYQPLVASGLQDFARIEHFAAALQQVICDSLLGILQLFSIDAFSRSGVAAYEHFEGATMAKPKVFVSTTPFRRCEL